MGYIYLASPYSHPDENVRHERYIAARNATATMLRQELFVYSPIVHCHDLVKSEAMPTDFPFWRDYNFAMLRPADALWVLCIPGWQESKGVMWERVFARKYDKYTRYIDCDLKGFIS